MPPAPVPPSVSAPPDRACWPGPKRIVRNYGYISLGPSNTPGRGSEYELTKLRVRVPGGAGAWDGVPQLTGDGAHPPASTAAFRAICGPRAGWPCPSSAALKHALRAVTDALRLVHARPPRPARPCARALPWRPPPSLPPGSLAETEPAGSEDVAVSREQGAPQQGRLRRRPLPVCEPARSVARIEQRSVLSPGGRGETKPCCAQSRREGRPPKAAAPAEPGYSRGDIFRV
jgi:hypothetical protein